MRKTILALAITAIMAGTISTSYGQEPDKKSEKAREDLKEAQNDSASEFQKFKKDSEEKIVANDKTIAKLKDKIANVKKENKAKYQEKLAELEQKNSDLKKKLDSYKESNKDKWEAFKKDFNKDFEEMEKAFKELSE